MIPLNRDEAIIRLSTLKPHTKEHCQLKAALSKTEGIVEISLRHHSYKVNTFSDTCRLHGGFGASEHFSIGEKVKLQGLPEDKTLLLKGTTAVRFEHIVALAGDYYGVAGGAISLIGGSAQDKTERFKKAFETLSHADHNQLRKIIQEIDMECLIVKNASMPHHCYSNQMIAKNQVMKKIKTDIDDLLIDNSDHFSKNALEAYAIGHEYAIQTAKKAGLDHNLEGLKLAYAMDAFACHFLTDLFASGHIRNQRGELEIFLRDKLKFSPEKAKLLAGLLTGAQHEQDGNAGLNVCNKKGDYWIAYGDGNFFAPKNAVNREKVIEATQQSADEIYCAYRNPANNILSIVDQLIPQPTPFNHPPLYTVEGEGKFLFIWRGHEKIAIVSQTDYINKGIGQALRYLPQEYINGVMSINIELHPVLEKAIIPVTERLTGTMWHAIGLATFHQSKKEFLKVNQKVDEMADTMQGTYETCLKILEQLKILDSKVDDLLWANFVKNINDAIQTVQDKEHEYKNFTLDEEQQKKAIESLWKAYTTLSSIFSKGTIEGKNVLAAYTTRSSKDQMSPWEVKANATLLFRQMLSYQLRALSLYVSIRIKRGDLQSQWETLKDQAKECEKNVLDQIEFNKDWIDETLIYEEENYINLQIQKNKTIKSSQLLLGNIL